jgi:hypothetical protein
MEIQLSVRCVIGRDYPLPMVNHAEISQVNMERMKQIYQQISLKSGPLSKYVRRRQRHMMEMTESVSRHGGLALGERISMCDPSCTCLSSYSDSFSSCMWIFSSLQLLCMDQVIHKQWETWVVPEASLCRQPTGSAHCSPNATTVPAKVIRTTKLCEQRRAVTWCCTASDR